MMTGKTILVMGGAHVDRRGRIAGETVPGASNPGAWFVEAGGGAFNAARNLGGSFALSALASRGGRCAMRLVGACLPAIGLAGERCPHRGQGRSHKRRKRAPTDCRGEGHGGALPGTARRSGRRLASSKLRGALPSSQCTLTWTSCRRAACGALLAGVG